MRGYITSCRTTTTVPDEIIVHAAARGQTLLDHEIIPWSCFEFPKCFESCSNDTGVTNEPFCLTYVTFQAACPVHGWTSGLWRLLQHTWLTSQWSRESKAGRYCWAGISRGLPMASSQFVISYQKWQIYNKDWTGHTQDADSHSQHSAYLLTDVSPVQWRKPWIQWTVAQLPVSPPGAVDHLFSDSRSLYFSRLHTHSTAGHHHSSSSTCFPAPSQAPLHRARQCVTLLGPSYPAQWTNWRVFLTRQNALWRSREGKK